MKNKLFIIGSIVILLAVIIGVYFIFFNNSDENKQSSSNSDVEDKLVAPASNTVELLKEMDKVEITNITEDEIVFSDDVELKVNEKVAVWIYSEPKFLGYFEILIEDGIKKIVGLKEALENISIEEGKHNIAITTESGEEIGYINVYVKENSKLTESIEKEESNEEETEESKEEEKTIEKEESKEQKTTTKEIIETVEIDYETTKQNEVNMLRGTTTVVEEGQKGQKTVTYKVTYDSNGKEISREKKREKITKDPVNRIEKVGISDFNMNTDILYEVSWGPMCTELTTNEYGDTSCAEGSLEYVAIKINYTEYITSIKENGVVKFSGLLKTSGSEGINLVANWNGVKYYFYKSAGGGMYELLTEETCFEYGLSCGRW